MTSRKSFHSRACYFVVSDITDEQKIGVDLWRRVPDRVSWTLRTIA